MQVDPGAVTGSCANLQFWRRIGWLMDQLCGRSARGWLQRIHNAPTSAEETT